MQLFAFVAEDNPDIRENLVGTLHELTPLRICGSAATEEDALRWLQDPSNPWDVAIVDLFLKSGSGIRVAHRLAGRRARQKVVIFSNYVDAHVRKSCAQLGVDAVFDKSTEIDALVDYCAHLCVALAGDGEPASQSLHAPTFQEPS